MKIARVRILMTSVAVGALVAGCGGSGKLARGIAHDAAKDALPADAGTGCLTHTRPPLCYAPRQFRVAYGVQPLVNRGIDGRGRTVVVLEPTVPSPTLGATFIQQDLSRYESRFGLPVAGLEVVSESAGSPSTALASSEELLDVEMVHAIAPGAGIRVVLVGGTPEETAGTVAAAVLRALKYAVGRNRGDVISLSVGIGEHCVTPAQVTTLHSVLRAARDRHITVIASAGDFGAAARPCGVLSKLVRGVVLPASDPLVTAIGGTRLLASPMTGRYVGETSWNRPPRPGAVGRKGLSAASGGGLSNLFPRPSYQDGIGGIDSRRGVPDVAADADPATGLALLAYRRGQNYIVAGGGTSASAPLWAAIAALADQYAGRRLGLLNAGLYRIGRGSRYHAAFHDITQGNNTVLFPPAQIAGYRAAPGWDPVTGWGSPNAEVLVPLLARYVRRDDGHGL
jgi:subtilase family serine protease